MVLHFSFPYLAWKMDNVPEKDDTHSRMGERYNPIPFFAEEKENEENLKSRNNASSVIDRACIVLLQSFPDPGRRQRQRNLHGGGSTTASAFVLTETQFRAEQAVLAGYEALTSGNENIVDGTVTEPIPTTNGTIEKDSYIRTASTTRGGDVPVEMKIIFTPTGTETESITVDITGSAADTNLTGFTADTYTATSGSETKEFDSTPSVFIAKNSNSEILQMINAYIDGSETGEFTVDEEASFINGNNPSWIVFTNPAIDSATHKVNFTPVDGTVSNFSLDDCLDVSETDVAISDAPAYKSEGLSKEDQEALEIGLEYLAYASPCFMEQTRLNQNRIMMNSISLMILGC